MVRLVFRPYTQVRRTICTSVSLRASTRVSSGFAPLRHSSPSFGSRQACSNSNPSQKIGVGQRCGPRGASRSSASLRFPGFETRQLARMSDSLVRVSRRVGWGARRPLQRGAPRGTPRGARVPAVPTTATGGARCPRALAASTADNSPRPEPSGGPAGAVPHTAGAHRRPPSASLPAISSTL